MAQDGRTDDEWLSAGWAHYGLPEPSPTYRELQLWANTENIKRSMLTDILDDHWPGALTGNNEPEADIRTAYNKYRSRSGKPLKALFKTYYQWTNQTGLEKGTSAILPKTAARVLVQANQNRLVIPKDTEAPPPGLLQMREKDEDRVALLDVMNGTGKTIMARGRGAPLDLRLFVHLLAAIPHNAMNTYRPEIVYATVRELAVLSGWGTPDGRLKWNAVRERPKLIESVEKLSHVQVPIIQEHNGKPALWMPLAVRQKPERWALDDEVRIEVLCPPGSADGPLVDMSKMLELSTKSAPQWRAYIAAKSLTWVPGKTRKPVSKRRGVWGDSRNAFDYPVLNLARLRELAFGANDIRNRTHKEILAPWFALEDFDLIPAVDNRKGIRGWRIMPKSVLQRLELQKS